MTDRGSLEARLRELEDRLEIQQLVARYNHTGNEQEGPGHAETFTVDGILEAVDKDDRPVEGWLCQGREAIAGLTSQAPFGIFDFPGGDHALEIDGDTATGLLSVWIGVRHADRRTFTLVTSGRYRDRYVRTDDGWRIARRTVSLDVDMDVFEAAMMTNVTA